MNALSKILFLLLLIILYTANASADKLYISSSENGTLVFSDRPVANAQVLQVEQVEVANDYFTGDKTERFAERANFSCIFKTMGRWRFTPI